MVKRKGSTTRRTSTKRSKTVSRQELRKIVLRTAETKLGYFTISNTINKQVPITWNLMGAAGMTGGTSGDNSRFIGDQFNMVGIRLRLEWINNVLENSETTKITVALVKAYPYNVATSVAAAALFPDYSLIGYPPRFDSSKCTVLMRKEITLRPQIAGVRVLETLYHYKKMDTVVRFDPNVGAFGVKGMQYYLVMYGENWGATLTTEVVATVGGVVEIMYKDM